ncbi:MAG TPA: carboxypeptidase-like regulatory domain-containing protein [Prolixibacteraceae bacterium]|nr:carboxypeptidase-like regulatory domain-containing protein [Prolixibacteraceae bacterium]
MKQITFFAFLFICSIFLLNAQQKSSESIVTNNSAKVRIPASPAFKLPYSLEILTSGEKDAQRREVVNGLTVKGSIVSAAVSSVSSLAGGAGGGAAAASYAATGRMAVQNITITIIQRETGDEATTVTDANGNFSLTLKHDTLHTILINGTEYGQLKLKTKHDTVKNSINNVR